MKGEFHQLSLKTLLMIIKKYMFTGQLHRHDHEEQRAMSPATSCDKHKKIALLVSVLPK